MGSLLATLRAVLPTSSIAGDPEEKSREIESRDYYYNEAPIEETGYLSARTEYNVVNEEERTEHVPEEKEFGHHEFEETSIAPTIFDQYVPIPQAPQHIVEAKIADVPSKIIIQEVPKQELVIEKVPEEKVTIETQYEEKIVQEVSKENVIIKETPEEEKIKNEPMTEVLKEENIIKEVPKEENIIKEVSKEENIIKEVPKEENIIKEVSKEENIIKEVPKEENIIKEVSKEENIIKEVPKKENIIKEVSKEENIIKEVPKEENIIKEIPKEEKIIKEIQKAENIIKETPKEEEIIKEIPKEENIIKNIPKETVTIKEIPAEIIKQTTAINVAPVEEVTVKEEISCQELVSQELSPKEQEKVAESDEADIDDAEDDCNREKAAVKIQALYRGYTTRKQIDVHKTDACQSATSNSDVCEINYMCEDINSNQLKLDESKKENQVHFVLDEKKDAELCKTDDATLTNNISNKNEVNISSQEHENLTENNELIEDVINESQSNKVEAAVKIQAAFRGHIVRKEMRKKNNPTSSIEEYDEEEEEMEEDEEEETESQEISEEEIEEEDEVIAVDLKGRCVKVNNDETF